MMQATYVDDLEHYLRQTKAEPGTLFFAINKRDYIGTLVRSSLQAKAECKKIGETLGMHYFAMPITIAKQLITQIYSSLSEDFFVSNLEDLEKFKQPVLVFSNSQAVVIEIQDNACVKS
jgi:hypothetical protein